MQATKAEIRCLADAVTGLVEGAHRGMARTYDLNQWAAARELV